MRAESQWRFSPLDEAAAAEICGWRYPEPYAEYDLGEGAIHTLLDPTNSYFGARDAEGALVGFCCFGPEAQVPGGTYDDSALDVGLGLRPDLSGKGAGAAFAQAVLALGCDRFAAASFRVTIAAWNTRSLRMHEHLGFHRTSAFRRTTDNRKFIQMVEIERAWATTS
ncbi:MAG: GNAT family N-acetyltransferase [Chloroflexi bacterium]|nr:GNAT family N-acetyltransferase [Chloroflexota bacterium]